MENAGESNRSLPEWTGPKLRVVALTETLGSGGAGADFASEVSAPINNTPIF